MKLQNVYCGTSYVTLGTDSTTLTFKSILLSLAQFVAHKLHTKGMCS